MQYSTPSSKINEYASTEIIAAPEKFSDAVTYCAFSASILTKNS